jgi:hypothetical protein
MFVSPNSYGIKVLINLNNLKPENMKTMKSSQILFALIFTFSLLSLQAIPAPKKTKEMSTQKTIRHYIKFPSVLLQPTEVRDQVTTVEVLYTTDSTGHVNFAFAKTEDPALKVEVEKQVTTLVLPQVKANVVHKMVLNFKLI